MSSEIAAQLFNALVSLEAAAQASPEKNSRKLDYRAILKAQVAVRSRLIRQLGIDNDVIRAEIDEIEEETGQ